MAGAIFDLAWVINAGAHARLVPFGKRLGVVQKSDLRSGGEMHRPSVSILDQSNAAQV